MPRIAPLTDPPGLESFIAEIRERPKYKALPPGHVGHAHVAAFEAMMRALYEDGADGNGFSIELYDRIRREATRKDRPCKERMLAIGGMLQTLERNVLGRARATRS